MNPNQQDWESVTFKKTEPKAQTKPRMSKAQRELNYNFDPESDQTLVTSNRSLGVAIQQARAAKEWKQSDLDQKCSFTKGTTQRYENGSAVYNNAEVNKMARVLGVNLPRPKKAGSK